MVSASQMGLKYLHAIIKPCHSEEHSDEESTQYRWCEDPSQLQNRSCCGALCAPWRLCACVAHRPRPLAQVAVSATGGAPIAPRRGRRPLRRMTRNAESGVSHKNAYLLFSFLTYDSFFFFFFISFFILMGRFGYSIGDKLFSRWVCSDRL